MLARTLNQKPPIGANFSSPPKSAIERAAERWFNRGKPLLSTTTVSDKTVPGQYFDAETNLHYNYFRYYDPELGRYITSDPIGLSGGLNTYLYANANPVLFVDLWGLYGEELCEQRCDGEICEWICEKIIDCVCSLGAGSKALCCIEDQRHCQLDCIGDPNPSECVAKCTSDTAKDCK